MKLSIRFFLIVAVVLAMGSYFVLTSISNPPGIARGKAPAQQLPVQLTQDEEMAQDVALSDPRVQNYTVGRNSEVLAIRKVGDHYPATATECADNACLQVEIYSWDDNATVTALVHVESQQVVEVLYLEGAHPGANQRVNELAEEIVGNAPEVNEILDQYDAGDVMGMMPMDASLVDSSCAIDHYCLALTYRIEDQILWAIVDLTDETLAGINWTTVSEDGSTVPHTGTGCPPSGSVTQMGWSVDHEVTGTDGLRTYNIEYNGRQVATSLKMAEWHADYGSSGFIDSTGCGGSGGGFPIYAYGDTYTNILMEGANEVGFEVVQDFRMSNWGQSCNYRYEQRHQFYQDGRFRVVAGAFGKGCGVNALYRPIVRMDLAVDGDTGDTVSIWDENDWIAQDTEFYRTPYAGTNGPHDFNPDGYTWRIDDAAGAGYYIEPAQGQFELGDRSDYPFFYVTLHDPAEGDTDLPVIGSCCLDDHRQGPHNYVDGEIIDSANLVLWYVSHMTTTVSVDNYYCWTVSGEPNPETYPCWSGPMFVPAEPLTPTAPSAAFAAGNAYVGVPTSFQNNTYGSTPISYEWDFGDGATSTLASPEHTYSAEGPYTVWMTATNSIGSDSFSQKVNVEAAIEAAFTTNGTNFVIGAPVEFTNQSTGPGELGAIISHWDFGDGEESTAEEPIHAYDAAGEYTVTLTVENDVAADVATRVLTVDSNIVAPSASFSHGTAYNGVPVQFSNMSGGTSPLTYTWEFGDGVGTSSLANPSYTYESPGAYTVQLTVTNKAGSSATSELLQVQAAVDAGFTTSTMNEAGEIVHFYNETTGYQPINYLWRFGDGVSSNGYDVKYSYDEGSHYLVRLSAANTVMTDEVSLWVNVADDMETLGPDDADKLQGDGVNGGGAELDVPEGAMDTEMDLFFTVFNELPGLASRGGQLSFMDLGATLEAYDNGVLQPDLLTDEPMTLLFEYEDILTEGADPGSVAVLYWNGSVWIDAADTCAAPGNADNDSDNQEISVPVCKVGHYAVFYLTVEHTIYLPLVTE